MPARQRLATHIGNIVAPDLQPGLGAPHVACGTPQDKERTGYLLASVQVSLVVDQINARPGAVVFTGGMDGRGIETADVLRQGLWCMRARRTPERILQKA